MLTAAFVVALLAAAGSAWLAWTLLSSERSMQSWPQVPGRVAYSGVERKRLDSVSPHATSAGHMYWEVVVRYEYVVGGTLFVGDQLSNRPYRAKAPEATQIPDELRSNAQRYPVGATVSVRHHPQRPERSTLEVDTGGSRCFIIAAAVAALAASALAVTLFAARSAPVQ